MKKQFNTLLLIITVFFASCSCNERPKVVASKGDKHVALNSSTGNSAAEIITRDSIIVLKYKTQTDTVRLPLINAKFPNLAKSLTSEAILGERLSEIKANYEKCGCGYTSLTYQKSFSNSKIISLSFYTAFTGPYSSETNIYLTLNISTGKPYKLTDQLTKAGQNYLLAKYKDTILKRLDQDKAKHTESQYVDAYQRIKNSIVDLTFEGINENYLVSNNSINVKTEPVLPHMILIWEINRNVDFSLDELQQFRNAGASI